MQVSALDLFKGATLGSLTQWQMALVACFAPDRVNDTALSTQRSIHSAQYTTLSSRGSKQREQVQLGVWRAELGEGSSSVENAEEDVINGVRRWQRHLQRMCKIGHHFACV